MNEQIAAMDNACLLLSQMEQKLKSLIDNLHEADMHGAAKVVKNLNAQIKAATQEITVSDPDDLMQLVLLPPKPTKAMIDAGRGKMPVEIKVRGFDPRRDNYSGPSADRPLYIVDMIPNNECVDPSDVFNAMLEACR